MYLFILYRPLLSKFTFCYWIEFCILIKIPLRNSVIWTATLHFSGHLEKLQNCLENWPNYLINNVLMKVYFEYANIYKILFRKADWLDNWLIKYRVITKTLQGVIISSLISLHCQIKTLLPVCLRVHSNNISTLAPAWWIEWLSSNLGSRLKLNRSFISSWCHLTLRECGQKWQPVARCQSWQWPESR